MNTNGLAFVFLIGCILAITYAPEPSTGRSLAPLVSRLFPAGGNGNGGGSNKASTGTGGGNGGNGGGGGGTTTPVVTWANNCTVGTGTGCTFSPNYLLLHTSLIGPTPWAYTFYNLSLLNITTQAQAIGILGQTGTCNANLKSLYAQLLAAEISVGHCASASQPLMNQAIAFLQTFSCANPPTGSNQGQATTYATSLATYLSNNHCGTDVFTCPTTASSTGEINQAFSLQLSAPACPYCVGPFTYAFTNLPTGLTGSSTGLISGTPTVPAGDTTYSVTITDVSGIAVTTSCVIHLYPVVVPTCPNGGVTIILEVGQPVSPYTLTASGGTGSGYVWTAVNPITTGGINSNMQLSTGGVLSQLPSTTLAVGNFDYQVCVHDGSFTATACTTCHFTVDPILVPSCPVGTITGEVGQTFVSATVSATGGAGSGYIFSPINPIMNGVLNSGVQLTAGGQLQQIGGSSLVAGSYQYNVCVKDGISTVAICTPSPCSFTIYSPVVPTCPNSGNTIIFEVGQTAKSYPLTATGGTGTGFVWTAIPSITNGALVSGMQLTSGGSLQLVSSATLVAGTYTYHVCVKDSLASTSPVCVDCSFTVDPILVPACPKGSPLLFEISQPVTPIQLTASGGAGSGYAWSVNSPISFGGFTTNMQITSTGLLQLIPGQVQGPAGSVDYSVCVYDQLPIVPIPQCITCHFEIISALQPVCPNANSQIINVEVGQPFPSVLPATVSGGTTSGYVFNAGPIGTSGVELTSNGHLQQIAGSSLVSGSYPYQVCALDSLATVPICTTCITLHINGPVVPACPLNSPLAFEVGQLVSPLQLTATGGTGTGYLWTTIDPITTSGLTSGLRLTSDGILQGVSPASALVAGNYTYHVCVKDSSPTTSPVCTDCGFFIYPTLVSQCPPSPTLYEVGQPIKSIQLVGDGGTSLGYSWTPVNSIETGGLVSGMQLTSSGLLQQIPGSPNPFLLVAGAFDYSACLQDSLSSVPICTTCHFTVESPLSNSCPVPTGFLEVPTFWAPFSVATTTGGTSTDYSFIPIPAILGPAPDYANSGVEFTSGGVLQPIGQLVAGTYDYQVCSQDSITTVPRCTQCSFVIYGPVVPACPNNLPSLTFEVGENIQPIQLTATGGTGVGYNWAGAILDSVTSKSSGLEITSDGILEPIVGVPLRPGTYPYSVCVGDNSGVPGHPGPCVSCSLTIYISLSTSCPNNDQPVVYEVGQPVQSYPLTVSGGSGIGVGWSPMIIQFDGPINSGIQLTSDGQLTQVVGSSLVAGTSDYSVFVHDNLYSARAIVCSLVIKPALIPTCPVGLFGEPIVAEVGQLFPGLLKPAGVPNIPVNAYTLTSGPIGTSGMELTPDGHLQQIDVNTPLVSSPVPYSYQICASDQWTVNPQCVQCYLTVVPKLVASCPNDGQPIRYEVGQLIQPYQLFGSGGTGQDYTWANFQPIMKDGASTGIQLTQQGFLMQMDSPPIIAPGTYDYQVCLHDTFFAAPCITCTFEVAAQLVGTCPNNNQPIEYEVGQPFPIYDIIPSGGYPPYSWTPRSSIIGPAPDFIESGVEFTDDGKLKPSNDSTPLTPGEYQVQVCLQDSLYSAPCITCSFITYPPLQVTCPGAGHPVQAEVGHPFPQYQAVFNGGDTPTGQWMDQTPILSNDDTPHSSGVQLVGGMLSDVSPAGLVAGTYDYKVCVQDTVETVPSCASCEFTIFPPMVITCPNTDGSTTLAAEIGQPFPTNAATVSGGSGVDVLWSVDTVGQAGVQLVGSSLAPSTNPATLVKGEYPYQICVQDSLTTACAPCILSISPALVASCLDGGDPIKYEIGQPIPSIPLTYDGGSGVSVSWTPWIPIISVPGNVNSGFELTSDGLLHQSPGSDFTPGSYDYSVCLHDSLGSIPCITCSLIIKPQLVVVCPNNDLPFILEVGQPIPGNVVTTLGGDVDSPRVWEDIIPIVSQDDPAVSSGVQLIQGSLQQVPNVDLRPGTYPYRMCGRDVWTTVDSCKDCSFTIDPALVSACPNGGAAIIGEVGQPFPVTAAATATGGSGVGDTFTDIPQIQSSGIQFIGGVLSQIPQSTLVAGKYDYNVYLQDSSFTAPYITCHFTLLPPLVVSCPNDGNEFILEVGQFIPTNSAGITGGDASTLVFTDMDAILSDDGKVNSGVQLLQGGLIAIPDTDLVPGTYKYKVCAKDSYATTESCSGQCQFTIDPVLTPHCSLTEYVYEVGQAIPDFKLTATGGTATGYGWQPMAITDSTGSINSGIVLATDGSLQAAPGLPLIPGTYPFSGCLHDSLYSAQCITCSIQILPALVAVCPNGVHTTVFEVGQPFPTVSPATITDGTNPNYHFIAGPIGSSGLQLTVDGQLELIPGATLSPDDYLYNPCVYDVFPSSSPFCSTQCQVTIVPPVVPYCAKFGAPISVETGFPFGPFDLHYSGGTSPAVFSSTPSNIIGDSGVEFAAPPGRGYFLRLITGATLKPGTYPYTICVKDAFPNSVPVCTTGCSFTITPPACTRPPLGCVYSASAWSNFINLGSNGLPQQLGLENVAVWSRAQAILSGQWCPSTTLNPLLPSFARELLAAGLNMGHGADPSAILQVYQASQNYLTQLTCTSTSFNFPGWIDTLALYNAGNLNVPICQTTAS